MRHHDGIHARFDPASKRRQLDGIQARPISRDLRHSQMRVSCRVAVPRKMLDGRQHPTRPRTLDVSCHHLADLLRIFPE